MAEGRTALEVKYAENSQNAKYIRQFIPKQMFIKTQYLLPRWIFLMIISLILSCQAEIPSRKLNGISLVASRDSLTAQQIEPLIAVNANSVALMPFGFLRDTEDPELYFNLERQWFGERAEGMEQAILLLKERNLKIMVKPQIWIRGGEFTGDLKFNSEADWKKFERSYREFILLYAKIAEKHKVELFCIGTELFNFVKARPEFWDSLIAEVRKEFNGKIVYAENWDKVDQTAIWKNLDYIGVDAYFPLHDAASPNKDEIKESWQKHKTMLKGLSSEYLKPILFTEYGYRNIDHSLKEPWNSDRNISSLNHNLQAKALESLFEEFWIENWFAGGFLWKWHQHEDSGGLENDRFTPQNKPAENTVKEYYAKFRN